MRVARRRLGDWFVVVSATAAMLVLSTSPAQAHAALVSSDPEAGASLAVAPGVVRLRFSEPHHLDLSTMSVVDPTGKTWPRSVVGERVMSVSLDTAAQGVYRVEWKTVSPLDGHTLRGEFTFGVGVSPGESEELEVGPASSELVLGGARAVEDAALLLLVGALAVGWLARRSPVLSWVRTDRALRMAAVAALGGGLIVVFGEAMIASPSLSVGSVSAYLGAPSGVPRLVRLAAEGAVVLGAARSRRLVAGAGVLVAVGGLAAAGHAAAASPRWWGFAVATIHLAAAGVWAGGIGTLAMLRPPDGWKSGTAHDLLGRFSPVAVTAFLGTVAFGGLRAFQELATPRDLVATSYGTVLLVKVVAVALMVPLSLRAWRRRQALPRVEAGLALSVVLAAAVLAAYPLPPARLAEAEAVAEGSQAAFPQDGDLTLGTDTGETLVGLTLRPGRPGPSQALVYVLPPGGEEAAVNLDVHLRVGDRDPIRLERCGTACRTTTVRLDRGETIRVAVEGEDEPAVIGLPDLPAPDGTALIELLDERMGQLTSLRYQEVLGPAHPPVRSTVEMVAPDRIRVVIANTGAEQMRIADTVYSRRGPSQAWEESEGPTVAVPAYVWDYPNKTAVTVIGREELEGVSTQVVSFFVNVGEDLPIWYRLWVDDSGLVHRGEMRAEGHFMDHTYTHFDAPITITAPTG
jgi:copper transport protein